MKRHDFLKSYFGLSFSALDQGIEAGGIMKSAEALTQSDLRSFIISNETIDRHKAVLAVDGWKFKTYNSVNPVVTLQHADSSTDLDVFVGKGKAYKDEKNLCADVLFDIHGEGIYENITAKKLLYKLDNKFLNCPSVRLYPLEWAWGSKEKGQDENVFYFAQQELIALSLVGVPANPKTGPKKNLEEFLFGLANIESFINEPEQKDFLASVFESSNDESINPDLDEKHISNIKTLIEISQAQIRLRA